MEKKRETAAQANPVDKRAGAVGTDNVDADGSPVTPTAKKQRRSSTGARQDLISLCPWYAPRNEKTY